MTDDPHGSAEVEALRTAARAAHAFIEACRRCDGDPDAMTDLLMETLMAPTVRQMRGSAPVDPGGHSSDPVDALRELVRFKAREVAALLEAENQARH